MFSSGLYSIPKNGVEKQVVPYQKQESQQKTLMNALEKVSEKGVIEKFSSDTPIFSFSGSVRTISIGWIVLFFIFLIFILLKFYFVRI
jgi:hypothetical protein